MRRTSRIPGIKTLLISVLTNSPELETVTNVELTPLSVPSADTATAKRDRSGRLEWPQRSLADVLKYDPLARRKPNREEVCSHERAVTDSEISTADEESPVEVRLKAIYRTQDGLVALVGSEIVKEGQRLKDGSLVVAIREEGIAVRPEIK